MICTIEGLVLNIEAESKVYEDNKNKVPHGSVFVYLGGKEVVNVKTPVNPEKYIPGLKLMQKSSMKVEYKKFPGRDGGIVTVCDLVVA